MKIRKSSFILFIALFSGAVAGCATTDQQLSRQYQPVVHATGGSGELYLAVAGEESKVPSRSGKPRMRRKESGEKPEVRDRSGKAAARKGAAGKFVFVTVQNDRGKKLGILVSPISSDELLRDAFRQELSAAGYTVRLVNTLPQDVGKGIELSHIFVDVEQVSGLLMDEESCRVKIGMDLWRNGARMKRLSYESSFSDSAIMNRDLLLQAILQKALQNVMKQAIPEVIETLSY